MQDDLQHGDSDKDCDSPTEIVMINDSPPHSSKLPIKNLGRQVREQMDFNLDEQLKALGVYDENKEDEKQEISMIERERGFSENLREKLLEKKKQQELDIDEELKQLGLFEEGMSREQKQELLLVLAESRETAKQEEKMRRKTKEWENIYMYEEAGPSSSFQNSECTTITDRILPGSRSPSMCIEMPESPQSVQGEYEKNVDSRKNSRYFAADMSQENYDSQKDSLLTRRNSRIFKKSLTHSSNLEDRSGHYIDNAEKMETNENKPFEFETAQSNSTSSSPKDNFIDKQLTLQDNLAVWPDIQSSDIHAHILSLSHKRKEFQKLWEQVPYFAPDDVDPESYIHTIAESIRQYHLWMYRVQRLSLTHIPWGDAIAVGRHRPNTLDLPKQGNISRNLCRESSNGDNAWMSSSRPVQAVTCIQDTSPDLEPWMESPTNIDVNNPKSLTIEKRNSTLERPSTSQNSVPSGDRNLASHNSSNTKCEQFVSDYGDGFCESSSHCVSPPTSPTIGVPHSDSCQISNIGDDPPLYTNDWENNCAELEESSSFVHNQESTKEISPQLANETVDDSQNLDCTESSQCSTNNSPLSTKCILEDPVLSPCTEYAENGIPSPDRNISVRKDSRKTYSSRDQTEKNPSPCKKKFSPENPLKKGSSSASLPEKNEKLDSNRKRRRDNEVDSEPQYGNLALKKLVIPLERVDQFPCYKKFHQNQDH